MALGEGWTEPLPDGMITLNIGIIGVGLQGKRRASVFPTASGSKLLAAACGHPHHEDTVLRFSKSFGCDHHFKWKDLVSREDIDAVIVCTPPHLHAEMAMKAIDNGKHVLCEKPLARTVEEAEKMVRQAKDAGVVLKCGFNHRHHPGILQLRRWVDSGEIGEIDFARCVYGICGRPGYESEWRANQSYVGGGQLMEQGIHAIDLFRWFLGDLREVNAFTSTRYWKIHPLEDNAFVIFATEDGKLAGLHSSLTQWKNKFQFELSGHDGYATVEGLGGSYGTERASLARREFGKPFSEQILEYRGTDESWRNEWEEFEASVTNRRPPIGSGTDGLEAMKLVYAAYTSAEKKVTVKV